MVTGTESSLGHRPGRGAVLGLSGSLVADDVDDIDVDVVDVDSVSNVDVVANEDMVGKVDAVGVNISGSDTVDDEILVFDVDEDNLVGSVVVWLLHGKISSPNTSPINSLTKHSKSSFENLAHGLIGFSSAGSLKTSP